MERPTDEEQQRADVQAATSSVPLRVTEASGPGVVGLGGPRSINISDELKKEWHELVQGQCDRAVELVKKAWKDDDPLIFRSDVVVESIVRRVACNVIDYRSARSTAGNGANLLITGVRGVGKTSLMRGLWRVLSSLQGDDLVAVYHDYETGRALRPAELIFELFDATGRTLPEGISRADDFRALLRKLWQAGLRVAMFLDEVQSLFVPVGHGDFQTRLGIAKDIVVLGKSEYDCFGVLSGSASNVRDLAYHRHAIAQAGGYPNFNDNVFCAYHMSPIRDREELRGIMPPGFTSDEQVAACFRATGGVGRSLERYMCVPDQAGESHDAMADRDFQEELAKSDAFFALVAKMAHCGAEDDDEPQDVWKLAALEYDAVQEIVLPRLESPVEFGQSLLEWLDRGFLYKTPDNTYQVLVPSRLASFASYLARSSLEDASAGALRAALLGMVSRIGWADGESSAARLVDRHLCKRLCEDDTSLEFWDAVSAEPPTRYRGQVRLVDVTAVGQLISPSPDCVGIDGVYLTRDPVVPGAFHLHTLRVQSGRVNVSITCGGVSVENQDRKADRYMRGIVFKARRGIEAILRDLDRDNNTNMRITKITFVLVTTKRVVAKAAALLKEGFQAAGKTVVCHLHDQARTLALFEPKLRRIIGE